MGFILNPYRFAGGDWTPADADLRFWYDGVDSVDGSNLLDLSGNGLTLIKSGTVTTGGSPLNGYNTLQFGGAGHYFDADAADWTFLHYNAVTTVLMVVKVGNTSNPSNWYGLFGTNGTSSAQRGVSLYYDDISPASDKIVSSITRGVSTSFVRAASADNAITPNDWQLIVITFDPANATVGDRIRNIQIDDTSPTMSEAGTATQSSSVSGMFNLGASGTSTAPGKLVGGIAEIVGLNGTTDLADTFNYLNTKYALGLTPL